MGPSDELWLSVVDAFTAAAVGAEEWPEALGLLAEATGSEAGQLIGFGPRIEDNLHWVADPEPAWLDVIDEVGGTDPEVNPRLRAGVRAPVLTLLTDQDVITREERRRHPLYVEFLERFDRPFICATNLFRESERWTGLAVLRTRRQGEITGGQRALFAAIAPHVRAAVHAQTVLENQGAQVLSGALEALSVAAFILDGRGMVRAMTLAAEAFVARGTALGLKSGRLHATRRDETSRLTDLIRRAAGGIGKPADTPLDSLLIHREGEPHLVLDIVPLPRRPHAFGFEPRVLVVARGAGERNPARTLLLLQTALKLTAAEAEVALRLADGESPETIAAARGVSVSTVRVQIKAIYAKLQVHRQSELIARINHLR